MSKAGGRCEFGLTPAEVYPRKDDVEAVEVEKTADGWELELLRDGEWGTESIDEQEWNRSTMAFSCWREAWHDGRCIWHADVEAKPVADLEAERTDHPERLDCAVLSGSEIRDAISFRDCSLDFSTCVGTDFENADLRRADLERTDFTHASLRKADLADASLKQADLIDAYLYEADLTHACLEQADLSDAYLKDADLTDASLRGANLTEMALTNAEADNADFEGVTLTRTNLFDADLTGAQFYGATFDETKINRGTEFGDQYRDLLDGADGTDLADDEETPWDKAAWSYRQIETLSRRHALPEKARKAFEDRKDVRRDQHWHDDGVMSWVNWGLLKASRELMGYGNDPERVARYSVALVVVFALLYPIPGIRQRGKDPITYADFVSTLLDADLLGAFDVLFKHFYFSFVTFTPLGHGDFQPVGFAQLLATVESVLGIFLAALFVGAAVGYVALGSWVFQSATRRARRLGVLGDY